ncbi:MAG: hypothetical protein V7L25_12685 [Nostoc sp.]|uniref:hypothetical protein n=1 Tax=Nostoc sp. TaxID=1180 RepID=UPI002FF32096
MRSPQEENKGFLAIEDWFEAFEQIQPGAMAQAPAVGDRNALDTNGTQFVAN